MSHYASKVLYTVDGWVERNMDNVPQSFSETLLASKHKVGDRVAILCCFICHKVDTSKNAFPKSEHRFGSKYSKTKIPPMYALYRTLSACDCCTQSAGQLQLLLLLLSVSNLLSCLYMYYRR